MKIIYQIMKAGLKDEAKMVLITDMTSFKISIDNISANVVNNVPTSDIISPIDENQKDTEDNLGKAYYVNYLGKIVFSEIEKKSMIMIGNKNSYNYAYLINVMPLSIVSINYFNKEESYAEIITPINNEFSISLSNSKDFTKIDGVAKDTKIMALETDDELYFTGADNIAITTQINGDIISKTYPEIKSTDFVKINFLLSNDNVTKIDYNPFLNQ